MWPLRMIFSCYCYSDLLSLPVQIYFFVVWKSLHVLQSFYGSAGLNVFLSKSSRSHSVW